MEATFEQKKRMSTLIQKLNQATIAYDKGKPFISDKEWDDMYFELAELEKITNTALPSSPVRNIYFQTVSQLNKVEHDHLMLSLDKTKDIQDIKTFIGDKNWIAMCKMDGLTCSLHYKDGKLISAETRGNGLIGEDIFHNAKVIKNIPQTIYYEDEMVVDGEIICTYNNFKNFSNEYKNPRNFASGSIRLLNSEECYKRKLSFVAWDMVKGKSKFSSLSSKLNTLIENGFDVVPHMALFPSDIDKLDFVIDSIKSSAARRSYPIDGIVFKYNNIKEYEDAGHTDHHFKGGLAYKFYDETYPTRLNHITWTMGRTGVLTPVAIFDPIEIDGTEITRASLHNVSIMKEILGDCAYVGEPLEIYKANQIIPQIYSAGPKYNHKEIIAAGKKPANDVIEYCPICNHPISYKEDNGIIRAYCDNSTCEGKLINRLDHFCGKKGLDIKGLSKKTLEKLIEWGWINNVFDIFNLKNFQKEWIEKSGFGKASVTNILDAIEEATKCNSAKYICALGIPLIGKVASKALMDKFKTYENFRLAIKNNDEKLYQISGIGEIMIKTLLEYDYTEADNIFNNFIQEEKSTEIIESDNSLKDNIFCITGKLQIFKNRDELKSFIESKGGKVTNSVTSKTTYLINNDQTNTTTKNATAIKLNIPIIDENKFLEIFSLEKNI